MSETVHVRAENGTAWITLDRPPLNVLDIAMMLELGRVLDGFLPANDILIFQGAGQKGFSAGAEVRDHVPERVGEMLSAFHDVFRKLSLASCLTIAAVHGVCLGGGMELAAFCDFVVATESAKFGQPEIKLGCFPPVALVILPRLCGMRAATDLILTGRTIDAREAQRLGLVSRIAPDDGLLASVGSLLAELRSMSPDVLRLTQRTLRRLSADEFETRLADAERVYLTELMRTHDAQEGINAFLEKRAPLWQGKQARGA